MEKSLWHSANRMACRKNNQTNRDENVPPYHPQDTNRLVLETVTAPGHGNRQFASSPRWLTLIFCEPSCWNPLAVTHRAIGLLSKPTAVHNRLCRRRPAPACGLFSFFLSAFWEDLLFSHISLKTQPWRRCLVHRFLSDEIIHSGFLVITKLKTVR